MVKLPFNKKVISRRRISRAVARNRRELNKVQSELTSIKKKYRTAQRRLQRMQSKRTNEPSTPRSRTEAQLKAANLNNDQAKNIRRQLLMGNVVMDEVRATKKISRKKKVRDLTKVISGRIVKKYRCASLVSKCSSIDRRTLGSVGSKNLEERGRVKLRDVHKYMKEVVDFLQRDDNSRSMPGKADHVTTAEGKVQQRVLTDYMATLHQKFLAENPHITISLSTFQRIRPKHVKTTAFVSRTSCLCTKHQNFALLMRCLKREGVEAPANPERYLDRESSIDDDTAALDQEITYEEWRRVAVEEKDKKKMVMRIVKVTTTKESFIEHLKNKTLDFKEHVKKMRNQYAEIRRLKQSLPPHHVVLHMDFSENNSCKTLEEIQSAYWNQTSVTLHPIVVYTDSGHQSYVFVSDDLNHNASAVVTFVKKIIEDVKALIPEVECIHYWTDSPTSQYWNRSIFHLLANHEAFFGVKAQWNFFEAGHGKGPCDGLGGSTKRHADQAMKNGKVIIQDATDFYAWTQSTHCTMTNVQFRFIPREACEQTTAEINTWGAKAVRGTMKIHAVKGLGDNRVLVRDIS